jgi:hypothetical protein
MVDSAKGRPMVDPMEDLPAKVDTIEQKLDGLIVSTEQRFAYVDERFTSVDKRFDAVDKRFDAVDKRFDAIDKRFDAIDAQFAEVTFALVEQRQYTEFAFDRLRGEMVAGFGAMTTNFGRLERKLDQLVDRIIGNDA